MGLSVKLLPTAMEGAYEIVYVIGENALWGHGLSQQAFGAVESVLHLRADRVAAQSDAAEFARFAVLPADFSRWRKCRA